jgi:hypothetical protein
MEKQVKTPASRKKMPKPSLIWRFLSTIINDVSFIGGGAVFLFLLVLAILASECKNTIL